MAITKLSLLFSYQIVVNKVVFIKSPLPKIRPSAKHHIRQVYPGASVLTYTDPFLTYRFECGVAINFRF